MRAALSLFVTALVVVQASVCAAQIDRPPSNVVAPPPVLIHRDAPVRIRTIHDPARVPSQLRSQFVGSIADINQRSLTVVLPDGKPAVVHRDLVAEFETGVDHGSRTAHAMIGAGAAAVVGLLLGAAAEDDAFISQGEMMVGSAILCAPIGALIGAVCPAGKSWKSVPLENVEMNGHD